MTPKTNLSLGPTPATPITITITVVLRNRCSRNFLVTSPLTRLCQHKLLHGERKALFRVGRIGRKQNC